MNRFILLYLIFLFSCIKTPKIILSEKLNREFWVEENLLSDTLIPYRKGDKWGYVNTQRKFVIKPKFDNAYLSPSHNFYVVSIGDIHYAISRKGYVLSKFDTEDIQNKLIHFNILSCESSGMEGFINSYGVFIPQKLEQVHNSYSTDKKFKYLIINKDDKYSIKNEWGILKTDTTYKYIISSDTIPYLAVLDFQDKYGIIDTAGNYVIPHMYDRIVMPIRYQRNSIMVSKNNLWGIINIANEVLLPIKYTSINSAGFSKEGIVAVSSDVTGGYYFIDRSGHPISDLKLYDVHDYSHIKSGGFVIGEKIKGKVCVFNMQGEALFSIPNISRIIYLHNNYFLVVMRDRTRVIYNSSGKQVSKEYGYIASPPLKPHIIPLWDKRYLMMGTGQGKYGFITSSGEEIIKIQYDYVKSFYNGLAYVYKKDVGAGYINPQGDIVIPLKYNPYGLYSNFKTNYVLVKTKQNQLGFINRDGVEFFED